MGGPSMGRAEDGGSSCPGRVRSRRRREGDAQGGGRASPRRRLFLGREGNGRGGGVRRSRSDRGELHTPFRVVGVRSRAGGGGRKGKDPERGLRHGLAAGRRDVLAFETAGEGDTAVPLGIVRQRTVLGRGHGRRSRGRAGRREDRGRRVVSRGMLVRRGGGRRFHELEGFDSSTGFLRTDHQYNQ